MTVFVARTRGPFWSIKPSRILFSAAQIIATFIAVYGLFMAPLGWAWALFVWVYAFAWFLVNDRIKLVIYKVFDSKMPGILKGHWNHHMMFNK